MIRVIRTILGVLLISVVYVPAALFSLILAFMGDCAISDADYARGVTCEPLPHQFFGLAIALAVLGFAGLQLVFLRWSLGRRSAR